MVSKKKAAQKQISIERPAHSPRIHRWMDRFNKWPGVHAGGSQWRPGRWKGAAIVNRHCDGTIKGLKYIYRKKMEWNKNRGWAALMAQYAPTANTICVASFNYFLQFGLCAAYIHPRATCSDARLKNVCGIRWRRERFFVWIYNLVLIGFGMTDLGWTVSVCLSFVRLVLSQERNVSTDVELGDEGMKSSINIFLFDLIIRSEVVSKNVVYHFCALDIKTFEVR